MKYITEIAWLLSWPVLIYVSYRLAAWAVGRWEKKQPEENA